MQPKAQLWNKTLQYSATSRFFPIIEGLLSAMLFIWGKIGQSMKFKNMKGMRYGSVQSRRQSNVTNFPVFCEAKYSSRLQGQTHAWYADKPSLKLRASHWAEAPNWQQRKIKTRYTSCRQTPMKADHMLTPWNHIKHTWTFNANQSWNCYTKTVQQTRLKVLTW